MVKYKGYYIDHVVFNSKADIDKFVKEEAIKAYEKACRYFAKHPTMEACESCMRKADVLHNEYGLGYTEIEKIEIASMR